MKISIVTPTFNVAPYLEKTILSVIQQGVQELEYIIIDGGSTDGTMDVVDRYKEQISTIVSEPDEGTYDAVNKGFSLATGEIMAWIGGDDYYTEGSLNTVLDIFEKYSSVQWITSRSTLIANEHGHIVSCMRRGGFSKQAFLDGCYTEGMNQYGTGFINQESTFWRRSLWERAGNNVSLNWPLAADFELWARYFGLAEITYIEDPLSVFRFRPGQSSRQNYRKYISEAADILKIYQRKHKHKIMLSNADGSRWYQGSMLKWDSIVEQKFCYLDANGTLGALKELITTDFIS